MSISLSVLTREEFVGQCADSFFLFLFSPRVSSPRKLRHTRVAYAASLMGFHACVRARDVHRMLGT